MNKKSNNLKCFILFLLSGCFFLISCSQNSSTMLHTLFSDYWEFNLKSSPTFATYIGDHRYDDKLEDVSQKAISEKEKMMVEFYARLKKIDYQKLSDEDKLSYDILERLLNSRIEGMKFKFWTMPVTQQDGPHIGFPELISFHPFKTVQDYKNYITRLNAFPTLIDQTIENIKIGMDLSLVGAKVNIEKTIPQMKAQIVSEPEKSDLYTPFNKFPDTFSENDKTQLINEGKKAIENSIVPAYKKLLDFVENQYLPVCRQEEGIWSLPDGKERYEYLARYHTTTNLTPQEIFDLGKRELEWIHRDMNKIKNQVGFKGSLQQFIQHLRTSPKFYYTSKDSLMEGFRRILVKMDARLPELFGRLPRAKWDLKEIEAFRADAAPDAYYYSPPEDFSRPGYFYVNTSHLNMRPKYTMEALAYHEAVPGHHLQGCIQQELQNIPQFRKYEWFTSFGEGWALYSEGLPKELGFYADPYSDFGRLTYQAWRATRLIVDTGIHSFKWTRSQAIEFFKANTGLSEHNIVSEVERYIASPGQALAYKIGQLKIKELREKASQELGNKFNIRAFHDKVLEEGNLPLDVLEKRIESWIEEVKAKA